MSEISYSYKFELIKLLMTILFFFINSAKNEDFPLLNQKKSKDLISNKPKISIGL